MEEACGGCPWSEEITEEIDQLLRRYRLLKLGIVIAERDLTPWEASALLTIDTAVSEEQKRRINNPPLKVD